MDSGQSPAGQSSWNLWGRVTERKERCREAIPEIAWGPLESGRMPVRKGVQMSNPGAHRACSGLRHIESLRWAHATLAQGPEGSTGPKRTLK